jgi:hypothetical protein
MTAVECLESARSLGPDYQRSINAFVDAFRRADPVARASMVADAIAMPGQLEGLVAAVVSALCRELDVPAPAWVAAVHSPEPFFAFPARSFALRVRLMVESPPPFRIRNVFVPESYLSRA